MRRSVLSWLPRMMRPASSIASACGPSCCTLRVTATAPEIFLLARYVRLIDASLEEEDKRAAWLRGNDSLGPAVADLDMGAMAASFDALLAPG
jgi:hypothetical protein